MRTKICSLPVTTQSALALLPLFVMVSVPFLIVTIQLPIPSISKRQEPTISVSAGKYCGAANCSKKGSITSAISFPSFLERRILLGITLLEDALESYSPEDIERVIVFGDMMLTCLSRYLYNASIPHCLSQVDEGCNPC